MSSKSSSLLGAAFLLIFFASVAGRQIDTSALDGQNEEKAEEKTEHGLVTRAYGQGSYGGGGGGGYGRSPARFAQSPSRFQSQPRFGPSPSRQWSSPSYSSPAPPASSSSPPRVQDRATFIKDCVATHNKLRAGHGAIPLVVDEKLNAMAQEWADYLANSNQFKHRPDLNERQIGENLFHLESTNPSRYITGDAVVKGWYAEDQFYTFGTDPAQGPQVEAESQKWGHFTQLLWRGSQKIGCGISYLPKGVWVAACNYYPPGNVKGQFAKNVTPARSGFKESIESQEDPNDENATALRTMRNAIVPTDGGAMGSSLTTTTTTTVPMPAGLDAATLKKAYPNGMPSFEEFKRQGMSPEIRQGLDQLRKMYPNGLPAGSQKTTTSVGPITQSLYGPQRSQSMAPQRSQSFGPQRSQSFSGPRPGMQRSPSGRYGSAGTGWSRY